VSSAASPGAVDVVAAAGSALSSRKGVSLTGLTPCRYPIVGCRRHRGTDLARGSPARPTTSVA
jgi:hypothetical protein